MVAQDAANVSQDLRLVSKIIYEYKIHIMIYYRLDADFAGLMRMKKNAAHDVERAVGL